MLRGTRVALSSAVKIGSRACVRVPQHYCQASVAIRALSLRSGASPAPRLLSPLAAPAWRSYGTASSSRVVEEPARIVSYEDMKKLAAGHDANTVLVDVREPAEYDQGHIGDAINIPFKSMPGALGLEPAEFESTLGFPKPSTDKTLVFYCLGGVRSTSAEQLASTYGYKTRMNYLGSYQDWLEHESQQKV